MTDVLLQEDADGVRVLTLNRPGARNALSTELAAALTAVEAEEEVP
jgi:enoyl-CoA hydratase/carnithine racemase